MNRSSAAFQFSCERLEEQSERLYFWTFTFKQVPINDEHAMEDYHDFMGRITREWPGMHGVRVSELHRSHGIHFHALLDWRICIRRVKRLAFGNGRINGPWRYLDFGRMTVTQCDRGSMFYMAKYLTKSYRDRYNFGGRRRWGGIGGFDTVKCRDIEYDTPFHRNKPLLFGKNQMDYATMICLSHYSSLWGDLENWPDEAKMKVLNFASRTHRDGSESLGREPVRERIDLPYRIWLGHLDNCGMCRYGESMCDHGRGLYEKSMKAEWKFPEKVAEGMLHPVTNNEVILSEVEERDSEKNFFSQGVAKFDHPARKCALAKEGGKWVYTVHPWADYQDRTRIDPF